VENVERHAKTRWIVTSENASAARTDAKTRWIGFSDLSAVAEHDAKHIAAKPR